jgi:hypothetical protein
MKMQDARGNWRGSPIPATCPRCDGPMKIKTIVPTIRDRTVDDIVYACPCCGVETRRSVQRVE